MKKELQLQRAGTVSRGNGQGFLEEVNRLDLQEREGLKGVEGRMQEF